MAPCGFHDSLPCRSEMRQLAEMPMEVNINPSHWVSGESKWDKLGPFYEGDPVAERGATHTHAWGANFGSFVYTFSWPAGTWISANISARLSSEHPWYSSPPNYFSDVALVINGWAYPSKRVIPDNGSGRVYIWPVMPGSLQEGRNELKFVVKKNAAYRNGLCIYYQAVILGERDYPIVIRAFR
jgi:hypothetical protein